MTYFRLIHSGMDMTQLKVQLAQAPELWGEHGDRITRAASPHAESQDIWLRYFPRETLTSDDDFNAPGRCMFYPAWWRLPGLHRVVWTLMAQFQATELGGILITRLPPGGRILPHADDSWHAHYFNRKVYLAIQSNPWCINRCGDEAVSFRPGELWEFNNLVRHDVHNGGEQERLAAIMCFHTEEPPHE